MRLNLIPVISASNHAGMVLTNFIYSANAKESVKSIVNFKYSIKLIFKIFKNKTSKAKSRMRHKDLKKI